MSTYVWMKVLESAPERYDRGIRRLSGGRIESLYRRIAERVAAPGRRILDLGCGTGGVTLACAARGARVVGIDRDAGMLEVARSKAAARPLAGEVEWLQLGAVEIEDRFAPGSFDAAVACLLFSELTDEEQAYVLRAAHGRLVPGGELVVADEVPAGSPGRRLRRRLLRLPVAALTYLLTQTSTRLVAGLAEGLRAAGFAAVTEERADGEGFAIVSGVRPREGG